MATLPHNIEKSGFRKGEYVGYDKGGHFWRITRSTNSNGNWAARPGNADNRIATLFAFRLAEMGEQLERTVAEPPQRVVWASTLVSPDEAA